MNRCCRFFANHSRPIAVHVQAANLPAWEFFSDTSLRDPEHLLRSLKIVDRA